MTLITRRGFVQHLGLGAISLRTKGLHALWGEHQFRDLREDGAASLDQAAIKKFVSTINGHVITKNASDYESSRQVFNRAFDRRPELIVRCASASDIAYTLDLVQTRNLPLALRGGGHSRAGFSVCDGGVVIDLSTMSRVEVDAKRRIARAQAGALVRDLDWATQQFGLATTSGGCPTVGLAGLTLGGGEGFLMSKYGAACDNLLSAHLVTVDGNHVEASATANSDLFWAIRGGGGNFGVVTTLEYKLHPVTDVLAGTLLYQPRRIDEMLIAFSNFVEMATDEMNVVGVLMPSTNGTQFLTLVCHCGETGQGNELLAPLRALRPREDKIAVKSYLEMQSTINPYAPVAHFQTNLILPELSPGAIAQITAATKQGPPNTRVFIVPIYGAITRIGPNETAFPLRQTSYEVDLMGRWNTPGERENAVGWVKNLRDALKPFAHGVYINQLGETNDDLVRAGYGSNYPRLQEIKKKYDPKNVLRINQNVRPG